MTALHIYHTQNWVPREHQCCCCSAYTVTLLRQFSAATEGFQAWLSRCYMCPYTSTVSVHSLYPTDSFTVTPGLRATGSRCWLKHYRPAHVQNRNTNRQQRSHTDQTGSTTAAAAAGCHATALVLDRQAAARSSLLAGVGLHKGRNAEQRSTKRSAH